MKGVMTVINFKQNVLMNSNPSYLGGSEVETGIDTAYTDLLECMVSLEQSFFDINRDQMVSLHHGIVAESSEIIMEGFKDMVHSAVEWFKKLIQKIGDFFKKAFLSINSYIADFKKFISKNKEYLESLNPDFKMYGFKYTINANLPNISPIEKVVDDYMRDIGKLDKMTEAEVEKDRDNFNKDDFLDKLRGQVIGKGPVQASEFSDVTKKSFRDGSLEEIEFTVDKSRLQQSIDSYESLNNEYNEAVKMRNKTLTLLDAIKRFFEKGASITYTGDKKKIGVRGISIEDNKMMHGETITYDDNGNNSAIISKYFNMKFHQSKVVSSILTTASTEKVNALKEQLKQERVLIRKAMSQGNKKKEGDN